MTVNGDISEVVIGLLGAQGDGATADGLFVPRVLPGERVRISQQGHRGELLGIIEPSASRVAPPCPHFDRCGGCVVQHASDTLVADWKRDLILRALSARGIDGVEIGATQTSPPGARRRVAFSGKRTRKGAVVGLHGARSETIFPIPECKIIRPGILECVPALEQLVEIGASRKGEMRLTVTESSAGIDVAVTGGKPVEGALYGELVAIAATADLARLSWEGETVLTRRAPSQQMGRAEVVPPAGGFLQATREGEDALVEAVRKAVAGARRIADLFCGSGTFSLPLAEAAEVHAVEVDAAAVEALDQAWRQTSGLRRIDTETRDLFHRPLLARNLDAFDAVVIDPPRAGARGQFEHLAQSGVPLVASVSCNPATFARDARTLVDGGYRLDWVMPIDQFRWSPHVELAAAFSRS